MASVQWLEPLSGPTLGSKSPSGSNSRIDALHTPGFQPRYADAGSAGYSALEDYVVQFCPALGNGLCHSADAKLGNGGSRWWRGFLRYRAAIGHRGLFRAWI